MTKFRLPFDPVNESGFACCKPAGCLHRRGPSLFVNPTLVSSSFRGSKPAMSPALLVETASSGVEE